MIQTPRPAFRHISGICQAGLCVLIFLGGCAQPPPKTRKPIWADREPKKNLPEFMRGTIFERVDLENTEPYPVSTYGLVVNLPNTGDSTAPTAVREYMIKEM